MKYLNIYTVLSLFILGTFILFAATLSGQDEFRDSPEPETTPVSTIPLHKLAVHNNRQEISVAGKFRTDQAKTLSFMTGGIIDSILVQEGDEVRKGERLATLDLTEINARLKQAELQLEQSKRDYKRVLNLYADSVATTQELEDSKTAFELAEEALKQSQFNRKHAVIVASSGAFVLDQFSNPGETVQPGTPVLKVESMDEEGYFLRADVSDEEWATIQPGDSAQIEIASLAGQLEGRVKRKSKGAGSTANSFWIDLGFSENIPPESVASGMFGKAVIMTRTERSNEGVLYRIPYEALLDGDGNSGFVFVTNEGKNVQKISVIISEIRDNHVLIEAGGFAEKELIVSGSAYLSENSRINVIQALKDESMLSGATL